MVPVVLMGREPSEVGGVQVRTAEHHKVPPTVADIIGTQVRRKNCREILVAIFRLPSQEAPMASWGQHMQQHRSSLLILLAGSLSQRPPLRRRRWDGGRWPPY